MSCLARWCLSELLDQVPYQHEYWQEGYLLNHPNYAQLNEYIQLQDLYDFDQTVCWLCSHYAFILASLCTSSIFIFLLSRCSRRNCTSRFGTFIYHNYRPGRIRHISWFAHHILDRRHGEDSNSYRHQLLHSFRKYSLLYTFSFLLTSVPLLYNYLNVFSIVF